MGHAWRDAGVNLHKFTCATSGGIDHAIYNDILASVIVSFLTESRQGLELSPFLLESDPLRR